MSDKRPLIWEDVCCVINGLPVCIEVDLHAVGKDTLVVRGRDSVIPLHRTGEYMDWGLGWDYFLSISEDEIFVRKHNGVPIVASILAANQHDWDGQDLAGLVEPGRTIWCELMKELQDRLRIQLYRRSTGEKIPFERYIASAVR